MARHGTSQRRYALASSANAQHMAVQHWRVEGNEVHTGSNERTRSCWGTRGVQVPLRQRDAKCACMQRSQHACMHTSCAANERGWQALGVSAKIALEDVVTAVDAVAARFQHQCDHLTGPTEEGDVPAPGTEGWYVLNATPRCCRAGWPARGGSS